MADTIVIILAVIVALSSSTYALTCPYNNVNCKCVNRTVTCGGLQAIPPLATGSDVIAVDTLEFDDGDIVNIPANSLPPGLVKITISENPLSEISRDAFLSSATTLNSLSIEGAVFNRLPDGLLRLRNLTNLAITYTPIVGWNITVLQRLAPSLSYLYLQDVGLTTWPGWLSYLTKLRTLDIDVDNIDSIPDDAFSSMKDTLTEFSFEGANLTHLPKALASLTNLTLLDLSGNELLDINGRPGIENLAPFPCSKTLLTLNIASTGLSIVPNISSFTNVVNLDLSLNLISKIDPKNFPPNLLNLDLNQNNISEINDASFKNCSHLQTLNLAYNPLTYIHWSAFSTHLWLLSLDLTRTSLSQMPIALMPLSRLKSLGMAGIFSLICPCPPQPEWTQWYSSVKEGIVFYGTCSNQGTIKSYLNGSCQVTPGCSGNTAPENSSSHAIVFVILSLIVYIYHVQV